MLACSIHESTINNLHDKKVKVRAAIAAAATHMQAECNFKNEVTTLFGGAFFQFGNIESFSRLIYGLTVLPQ